MRILGIESSCDETAVAIVEDGHRLLANVVNSQIDIHASYGGVIPEVAARSHLEVVEQVIQQTLIEAKLDWDDIDAIAVTYAPGLSGSLLIGSLAASTLAYLKNKPLYPVHHVEAHVYANFIDQQQTTNYQLPSQAPKFPMLALIVSGGHSQLVQFKNHGDYQLLGQTTDDAVGEAFDKVAKIIGLPYPGGPSISKAAIRGDDQAFSLPKSKLKQPYDFSFSGLKTAVLRTVQREVGVDFTFPSHKLPELVDSQLQANIAASFQRVAVETLVDKTEAAFKQFQPQSVVIAGGVAANQELRRQLTERLNIDINYAPIELCTDNGAMIATLAYYQQQQLAPTSPFELDIVPSLSMQQTAWNNNVVSLTT